MIAVGILGLLFSWPRVPFFPYSNIAGLIILAIGLYGHKVPSKIHKQAHEHSKKIRKIITTGPYSKVRHPLYSFLFLIYFGFALSWGIVWMFIPAIIFSILTYFTAIKEEEFLKKKFGKKYENYMKRVPYRFVPKIF